MHRMVFEISIAALVAGMAAAPIAAQSNAGPAPTGEIVVTAQKRAERLIDVPSSVTALDAKSLIAKGAERFEDYKAFIPGVSVIESAPGYNQINIRGINTGANQLSSTVGTYFDEAPTNSSTSAALGVKLTPDPDLLDVARIEVLRGPQGTLYGANALGGVVKYVLVQPDLDAVHGQGQAGISSVAHGGTGYAARAIGSAPIVSGQLSIQASGFIIRDPGYIDNVALDKNNVGRSINRGGRIALLWKPSSDVSVALSSLYQQRKTNGLPQETVSDMTLQPNDGRYRQASATSEFINTKYQLHSLVVNADLGFARLTSATSYGRQQVRLAFDDTPALGTLLGLIGAPGLAVSLPVDNDVKKFTQEVRLASPGGHLFDYTIGAYYTHERSSSANAGYGYLPDGSLAPAPINPLLDVDLRNRYEETAIFANGTLNLSDRFNIQAGGRWSRNRQHSAEPVEGLLFGPLSGTTISQKSAETAWTFAVSPQFKITRAWNVYARAAKGFRPGGANLVLAGGGASPTYRSDSLINYEIGTKASLLDHHLDLSLSGFWIDWRNIQTTAKDALGFNYLLNGGKARSKGVEFEASWHKNGLTISGNLTYDKATTRDPIPTVGALAGDVLPYSPRWAGAASFDYDFPGLGDITPSIGASVRHTGAQQAYYSQTTGTNPGDLRLPSYTFLDLRAGLRWQKWQLSVFAQNVTDKHAILALTTDQANPLTGDDARATIARPRTVGATLGFRF